MKLADVAVATMTRARTSPEGDALLLALRALSRLAVPVIVADRESTERFRRDLKRLNRVSVVTRVKPGLVGQINASLAAAAMSGRRFILYTEPDKRHFFERHLRRFVADAPDTPRAVIVASRTKRAFSTFPEFQRRTETAANDLCRLAVGPEGDYFYGPFLFSVSLLERVLPIPDGLGWGWRPYLFATGRRFGYRVRLQAGNFACPVEQRWEDDAHARAHRLNQFEENARGIVRALI
jgi:hypothetical protein